MVIGYLITSDNHMPDEVNPILFMVMGYLIISNNHMPDEVNTVLFMIIGYIRAVGRQHQGSGPVLWTYMGRKTLPPFTSLPVKVK